MRIVFLPVVMVFLWCGLELKSGVMSTCGVCYVSE